MIRKATCALVVVLLATSGRGDEAVPKSERFMDCIVATLKWFTDLENYYALHQVEPEARKQSIRYLTKLQNSLSDLEIDKQEFTDALRTADLPKDAETLSKRADRLRSTVWELNRKLRDYTDIVPPEFRTSANSVETNLSTGLADKCDKLEHISLQLTGRTTVDRDQLVTMGKQTVEKIQELRSKVSELIEKLSLPLKLEGST